MRRGGSNDGEEMPESRVPNAEGPASSGSTAPGHSSESGKGEEAEGEGDEEESVVPNNIPNPRTPTKYEIEQHNLCHIPYRNWCPHCVRGKGINSPHKSKSVKPEDELNNIPRISMDYWYMGEEDRKAQRNPLLVVLNEDDEAIATCAVGKKGVQEWVVRKIAKELEGGDLAPTNAF